MSWAFSAMGGMMVLQGLGNKEQNDQAAASFVENTKAVKASYNKQLGQLQEQAASVQQESAMEMTKVRYQGLKNTASTSNKIVEQGISGATAARQYDQSAISQMMAHNALAKAAEDNAVSFGVEMENARDKANQAIANGQAQAAANTVSTLQGVTSVAKAGAQGYMMGSSLGSAGGSTQSAAEAQYAKENFGSNTGNWRGL